MNAATPSRFALVAEYLAEFIASVFPVWAANGCMVSLWRDGSLDQAWQALRADDGPTALGMLALAQQQARPPVGDDEENPSDLAAAQQERHRMALAARVALALTHEAMRQPCGSQPHPLAMLQSSHPVQARDDGQALDVADEDLEPLDFVLELDLSELSLDLSAPAGAASLNALPQG